MKTLKYIASSYYPKKFDCIIREQYLPNQPWWSWGGGGGGGGLVRGTCVIVGNNNLNLKNDFVVIETEDI